MPNQINDENVGLLKQLVTTVQKKNDKEKVDNAIKMKPAKVIGVDEDTYKVFVYFIDDIEQNAYTFYNKSGEVLSEGDNVRVYYTTNPAKGWIGGRCGEPNIKEIKQIIPYASKHIYNSTDADLGETPNGILNIDFTVTDNNSHCVLTANQLINVNTEGTVAYNYFIDDVESDFHPKQKLVEGSNIVTHVVPMEIIAGEHNIKVNMFSADAKGSTSSGNIQGVISGQISDVKIDNPPVYACVFLFEVEDGSTITIPYMGASGTIYWGDGYFDAYTAEISHTYEKAGKYKVTVDAPVTAIPYGYSDQSFLKTATDNYLREVVLSDIITEINNNSFYNSKVNSIRWSKRLARIKHHAFSGSNLSGSFIMPPNVNAIEWFAFYNSKISSVIIETPNKSYDWVHQSSYVGVYGNFFSSCQNLTTAVLNYKGWIPYDMFSSCKVLSKVTIGEGIDVIGKDAFRNCSGLTSITIPKSVKSIHAGAFEYTNITSVKIAKDCGYQSSSFPSNCTINYYD